MTYSKEFIKSEIERIASLLTTDESSDEVFEVAHEASKTTSRRNYIRLQPGSSVVDKLYEVHVDTLIYIAEKYSNSKASKEYLAMK